MERFVIKAVRACSSRTSLGFRFDHNTEYMAMTVADGGPDSCDGVTALYVGAPESVHASFVLFSQGIGYRWIEGYVSIEFGPQRSDFYCRMDDEQNIAVTNLETADMLTDDQLALVH